MWIALIAIVFLHEVVCKSKQFYANDTLLTTTVHAANCSYNTKRLSDLYCEPLRLDNPAKSYLYRPQFEQWPSRTQNWIDYPKKTAYKRFFNYCWGDTENTECSWVTDCKVLPDDDFGFNCTISAFYENPVSITNHTFQFSNDTMNPPLKAACLLENRTLRTRRPQKILRCGPAADHQLLISNQRFFALPSPNIAFYRFMFDCRPTPPLQCRMVISCNLYYSINNFEPQCSVSSTSNFEETQYCAPQVFKNSSFPTWAASCLICRLSDKSMSYSFKLECAQPTDPKLYSARTSNSTAITFERNNADLKMIQKIKLSDCDAVTCSWCAAYGLWVSSTRQTVPSVLPCNAAEEYKDYQLRNMAT